MLDCYSCTYIGWKDSYFTDFRRNSCEQHNITSSRINRITVNSFTNHHHIFLNWNVGLIPQTKGMKLEIKTWNQGQIWWGGKERGFLKPRRGCGGDLPLPLENKGEIPPKKKLGGGGDWNPNPPWKLIIGCNLPENLL